MKSYKDSAAYRNREPLRLELTHKRAGDLILRASVGPAEVVPGVRGRFAGRLA